MLSQPQEQFANLQTASDGNTASDQAANLPVEAPADAAKSWARFSAAWPFDPVPYRRAAARAEFEKLTTAEREEAIRSARTFAKAWRAGGRRGSPDARAWIMARRWEDAGKRIPQSRHRAGKRT